jgi:hypothetical protein
MIVTAMTLFNLNQANFAMNLVGQYYSCAQQGETEWILDADAAYNAPLTFSGLTLGSTTLSLVGTKNISSASNKTLWEGTLTGSIGAQFAGLEDVNANATVDFGTVEGLKDVEVHLSFEDDLVSLDIDVTWVSASHYNCSLSPLFNPETFDPHAPSFRGTWGSADLQLHSISIFNRPVFFLVFLFFFFFFFFFDLRDIIPGIIEVDALVAYDVCLDVWWISSPFHISDTINGLTINSDIDITLIGKLAYTQCLFACLLLKKVLANLPERERDPTLGPRNYLGQ